MIFTEKEIQNYIWDHKDDFIDFLIEPLNLDQIDFNEELSNVTAQSLVRNKINKKLDELHSKLYDMKFIGCEVPLEQSSNSTIRADFLAVFPGDTGFAVVELKKSKQTERQAFTELLAYSNHMTTLFPAMTRDDSVYILISPMKTRIARDAVIQRLTFDNRSIITLIPKFSDPSDISTLKLELWVPSESELAVFSKVAFREENFSVCKISWEYDPERWDAEKQSNPPHYFVSQFNNVSALAAQCMEETGVHGFTYCSQMWSELSDKLPYTNSLVLVGLNPYAVGSAQYLTSINANDAEIPDPSAYMPHIAELIKKLGEGELSESNEDVLSDLHMVWNSQLFKIGKQVVNLSTKNLDGKYVHIEYSFMNWKAYQFSMIEDVFCHNFAIRSTGLMRHLYTDILELDYDLCKKIGSENHPINCDMPYLGVDFLKSQVCFRQFILRMFHC